VIRRGFWLTVGAVAGIAGYRRASALGRRVSGRLTPGAAPSLGRHSLGRHSLGRHSLNRPSLNGPNTNGPSLNGHRLNGPGLAKQTIGFARDVREGMDLYMARHSPLEGPTLGARDLPPARRRSIPTNHDPRPKDGH
jgi:hypothetical protein